MALGIDVAEFQKKQILRCAPFGALGASGMTTCRLVDGSDDTYTDGIRELGKFAGGGAGAGCAGSCIMARDA